MNKCVYVIGAGASAEVRMPTGDALKGAVSVLLNLSTRLSPGEGDITIIQALQDHVTASDGAIDMRTCISAARLISRSMPLAISIDNFMHSHRDNAGVALCGKVAIVRSILQAEELSLLHSDPANTSSTLANTWYPSFFKLLTENCSNDSMLEERLAATVLIIFNYDRCIEHFLYHAFQAYYGILPGRASALVKCMQVYHPYGSVGTLPWCGDGYSMEFGNQPYPPQLLELARQIKTFTEGTDPKSSDISAIRNHMDTAHKVIFLGFAFHKLNMELMTPAVRKQRIIRRCYATAFEVSLSNRHHIQDRIASLCAAGSELIQIGDPTLKCADFFREYWESLAF